MTDTEVINIRKLWVCADANTWNDALERYWSFVKPENLELERSLDNLTLDRLRGFSPSDWYTFLLNEYFRWKYTAANRYASTTAHLRRWADRLCELDQIRHALLALDIEDIQRGLATARKIPGLGVAGASGLLALMYPAKFATVDQFVVKALRGVADLPEADRLAEMNPENLSEHDGVLLIEMLRRKATGLRETLQESRWTPRTLEKVLWAYGRKSVGLLPHCSLRSFLRRPRSLKLSPGKHRSSMATPSRYTGHAFAYSELMRLSPISFAVATIACSIVAVPRPPTNLTALSLAGRLVASPSRSIDTGEL